MWWWHSYLKTKFCKSEYKLFITCSSGEALDHPREVIAVGVAVPDEEDVLVALVELVAALVWVAIACGPHLTRGA